MYVLAVDYRIADYSCLMLFDIRSGYMRQLTSRVIRPGFTRQELDTWVNSCIKEFMKMYNFQINSLILVTDFPCKILDRDVPNKFKI